MVRYDDRTNAHSQVVSSGLGGQATRAAFFGSRPPSRASLLASASSPFSSRCSTISLIRTSCLQHRRWPPIPSCGVFLAVSSRSLRLICLTTWESSGLLLYLSPPKPKKYRAVRPSANKCVQLLGCVALLLVSFPFAFYKYGERIRGKSKFAPSPDIEQDKRRDEEARLENSKGDESENTAMGSPSRNENIVEKEEVKEE